MRQHSSPSIPGIITSHTTRSGTYFDAIFTPCAPSQAVITLYSSCSSSTSRARMSGLSSITSSTGLSPGASGTTGTTGSSSANTSTDDSVAGTSAASSITCLIGMTTVKTEPLPGVLSTVIVPPCNSTNALASDRPMPEPFGFIFSTWKKLSKICSKSPASIPLPVSATENSKFDVSARHVNVISPLSGVYLNALPMRLKNTLSTFSTSMARIASPSGHKSNLSFIRRRRASSENDGIHSSTNFPKSTSLRLSCILPFSYLRKSRISLISLLRILTLREAISRSECCRLVRLVASASCSTGSAIRVRGVRRSCDTLV